MPYRATPDLVGCPSARPSWLNVVEIAGNATYLASGWNMPGFRVALYGIFGYMSQKQARGSRFFGPNGAPRGRWTGVQIVGFAERRSNQHLGWRFDEDMAPRIVAGPVPGPVPGPVAAPRMQQMHVAQARLHGVDAPRAPRRVLEAMGVSSNYRGDLTNPKNLSANIRDDENCSFWLRYLPPNADVTMLLAAVRGVGRVYCTVVTPPNPVQGHHTAAAKLVFFDVAAARRFWDRYGRDAPRRVPFIVGDRRVLVERNRTKVAASRLPKHCSRVLRVTGPEGVVDVAALLADFRAICSFEMDNISVVAENYRNNSADDAQRMLTAEFRFGSYRSQAQLAYRMLQGRWGLDVRYGRDPCDL